MPKPKPKSTASKRKPPSQAAVAQARRVRTRLAKAIPQARCELDHRNAWQLLIATILSAQSTDRTINRVTPALFRRWKNAAELAAADRADVEEVVKSTGFFRNKARAIQETSRAIAAEHGGEVPTDMQSMLTLPGVARKTANVVLGTALGIATGMVVDTHVARVSQRLGLTSETNPTKIEADLCDLFAKRTWIDMSHRLLLHGRYVCLAKAPQCEYCALNEICPSVATAPSQSVAARSRRTQALVESRGEAEA